MVDVEVFEKRLEICRSCPLGLETGRGLICNPKLYINKEDKTSVSNIPKIGYVRGCSCLLLSSNGGKLKQDFAKCIVGK